MAKISSHAAAPGRTTPGGAISILVVSGPAAVRDAFATMFSLRCNMSVVGATATPREAVNLAWLHQPAIAIVDADLPDETGFGVVNALRTAVPRCRTIMLASTGRPAHLRRAYEGGAWAYLTTESSFSDIVRAVEQVHSGMRLIDPERISPLSQSPLTVRETQILKMVGAVGSTSEIAKHIYLSHGTINNYISSILAKLGASNRVQAVNIATNNGWL